MVFPVRLNTEKSQEYIKNHRSRVFWQQYPSEQIILVKTRLLIPDQKIIEVGFLAAISIRANNSGKNPTSYSRSKNHRSRVFGSNIHQSK
ncbi:MAG: hypothetical protein IGS23_10035 [Rivularia sp. T60_A2020_040]|nr:hypothetical protein [Rivularia sp. T60_A2020_040]